jgi:RNA polymerase sigma-70 factor (ECF subfamily)
MQIQHPNEIELIRQTLAGDTSAFDQLVKAHRRTIYVLALSYIKNPADAEDLTQRIFIQAYERLVTLRQLDHFLPWLQQIAHNACKDWIRCRVRGISFSKNPLLKAFYGNRMRPPLAITVAPVI